MSGKVRKSLRFELSPSLRRLLRTNPLPAYGLRRSKPARKARRGVGESGETPATTPPDTPSTADVGVGTASPQARPFTEYDYDAERAAFARRKPALLLEAPGQYVVFKGEAMIGPFPDFGTALKNGRRSFGMVPIYIKHVVPEEAVIYL